MLDPQVSLIRLLIGDNSRTAPVYSDAQIRSAVSFGARPALPEKLLLAGTAAATRYPSDVSGGPFTGPF
jgi:hypothetical protein